MEQHGMVRNGMKSQGKAWKYMSWNVKTRKGMTWKNNPWHGKERNGMAWKEKVRQC
jgi:hypothetical protein